MGSFIGLGSPYFGQPSPWTSSPYVSQGLGVSPFAAQPIAQIIQVLQIVPQQLQQLQYVQQQYLQQITQLLQTVPHQLQQLQQQLLLQQAPIGLTQGAGLGQGAGGGLFPPALGPQTFISQPGHVM